MTLAASSLNRVSRKVSAKHCQQTLLAFFLAAFTISCDERHQSQNVESKPKHLQTVTINNIEPRRDVAVDRQVQQPELARAYAAVQPKEVLQFPWSYMYRIGGVGPGNDDELGKVRARPGVGSDAERD